MGGGDGVVDDGQLVIAGESSDGIKAVLVSLALALVLLAVQVET